MVDESGSRSLEPESDSVVVDVINGGNVEVVVVGVVVVGRCGVVEDITVDVDVTNDVLVTTSVTTLDDAGDVGVVIEGVDGLLSVVDVMLGTVVEPT